MVSLRPGESNMAQTVMRKRITVFHQQLSPADPVNIKCTYMASGHAVAKVMLVSKQELAGKTSPKFIQVIGFCRRRCEQHSFFICFQFFLKNMTCCLIKKNPIYFSICIHTVHMFIYVLAYILTL